MDYFAANEKLTATYREWYEDLKEKQPQLLGENYSNPYYCSVPANWYEAMNRVLIVGEEGHGEWGCGKWGEGEWKVNYIHPVKTAALCYHIHHMQQDLLVFLTTGKPVHVIPDRYCCAAIFKHNRI